MAEQVTLPGVGPVNRKALYLGGGAAVIAMAVFWWHKRHAAAAAPAAGATDPNAVDPNAVDASGMAGGGGALTSTVPSITAPTTNAQWTQMVMQQLGGTEDPSALAQALGVYITGGPATDAQTRLIDEAIAAEGYPPVTGPNGYPPGIRTQPAGGQTGGGGGAVPGKVTGLRATEWGSTQASFTWAPVPGATSYVISQPVGTREVTGTEATVGGALGGNVRFPFTFTVRAKNAVGTGPAASITLQSPGGTH